MFQAKFLKVGDVEVVSETFFLGFAKKILLIPIPTQKLFPPMLHPKLLNQSRQIWNHQELCSGSPDVFSGSNIYFKSGRILPAVINKAKLGHLPVPEAPKQELQPSGAAGQQLVLVWSN